MEEKKKVPVSVYGEMTPNPAVLKFVSNQRLITTDSVEFKNIEEAQPSPLAVKLFHYPFVKEVFISGNYVAITKYDIVEWDEVTMEVREMLRDYLADGNPVMENKLPDPKEGAAKQAEKQINASHPDEKKQEDWEEIEHKIAGLLDEYVTPAVAQDGGNIKFLKYEEGTVKVLLQGACSGCPSSTQTLRQGIQNLLEQMLPGQIQAVEAVNG